MTAPLQLAEAAERQREPPLGFHTVLLTADAVPQQLAKFKGGVGEILHGGRGIEGKRLFVILLHALAFCIQTGERVLRILISLIGGEGKPLRRLCVILRRAESSSVHFSDAVFGVAVWLFFLHRMKGGKGFCVPCLRLFGIGVHAEAVRKHPSEVMHRQRVAGRRFLRKQREGLCKVLLHAGILRAV